MSIAALLRNEPRTSVLASGALQMTGQAGAPHVVGAATPCDEGCNPT